MKTLWTGTIAALFGLLMFAMPTPAKAAVIVLQPASIEQVANPMYIPAYYGRPWACRNPWFRHHHRHLCW